jgi:antitoxin component of MazEF toxin-antitoxin module
METITAKIFKAGNSQAVRLPKGCRFKSKTVSLVKHGGSITLTDPKELARRRRIARAVWGSCPDFPDVR